MIVTEELTSRMEDRLVHLALSVIGEVYPNNSLSFMDAMELAAHTVVRVQMHIEGNICKIKNNNKKTEVLYKTLERYEEILKKETN